MLFPIIKATLKCDLCSICTCSTAQRHNGPNFLACMRIDIARFRCTATRLVLLQRMTEMKRERINRLWHIFYFSIKMF